MFDSQTTKTTPARLLALGGALAYSGVLWLQLLLERDHGAHDGAAALAHWLRDGTLAVPAVVVGLLLASRLLGRALRHSPVSRPSLAVAAQAVGGSAALAAASPFHTVLFGGASTAPGATAVHALEVFLTVLPLAVVVATVGGAVRTRHSRERAALPRGVGRPVALSAPAARGPAWGDVRRRLVVGVTAFSLLAPAVGGAASMQPASAAAEADGVCPAGARTVTYEIAAFQTVIPLNGWGDHMPDGLMYALRADDAVNGKKAVMANPNLTQPLVIRANVGDCIKVDLRNDIQGRRVGIHPDGLVKFDPKSSDGARVGRNPDTTVATGDSHVYTWYADREGEAPLNDIANLDDQAPGHSSVQRGLYGAVVVHPKGSTWHDPVTGAGLLNGTTAVQTSVFADVRHAGPDFRSFAMVIMDENEDIVGPPVPDPNDRGKMTTEPIFPLSGLPDSTFGINYRSEPLRNRLRAVLNHRGEGPENPDGTPKDVVLPNGTVIKPSDHFCDGWVVDESHPDGGFYPDDPGAKCLGEESHLQSWPFGDQGKLTREVNGRVVVDSDLLIPKAYVGDPVKFHVVNPGAKETHPWHQHTHRWFKDANNPNSPRLDVESVGPGDSFTAALEGGAGGVQGTIGDSIFHCHLYPHFAQGFWGHLRVFDRLRDGTQTYPDGTPIEELKPLIDRTKPATPDADHPGFPLFVHGQTGQRAYRPPHAVVADDFAELRRPGDTVREPTALEKANLPALSKDKPGNGFVDPCPANAPQRTYRPHAIDTPITYNSHGWGDPEGRVYVERSHLDRYRGDNPAQPEPYTIRARLGECVQLLTTNSLHLDDDPNVPIDRMNDKDGAYMHESETSEVSTHVHLVKFDQLGSDGTSVGWNYVQAAMPGQTYGYRWFVDQPLRTVFFHDHQYAASHQQKGLFAALQVEPADATWTDPKTGAPTDGVGTVADIHSASGPSFREYSIYYQDFAPMWRNPNTTPLPTKPIHPPPHIDDFGADQGGMAINYRNEPFQERVKANAPNGKAEPAHVYSSAVHGDPSTPVFRAYTQDPVVVRFIPGSHEEYHTFSLHGHRWLSQPDNPKSTLVDAQTASLAEYYNFEIQNGKVTKKPLKLDESLERGESDLLNGNPFIPVGGAGRPGDYLYGSDILDDQWLGMWGIFRVPATQLSDLQPLPDTKAKPKVKEWPALSPGQALNGKPPTAVNTCPVDAPIRIYDVVALQKTIVYRQQGATFNKATDIYDDHGVMYALAADEAAIRAGTKRNEPLFIRANAGDCLQVKLTNKLPKSGLVNHPDDTPLPEPVANFPRSHRVSLHAGMLDYDVTRADGSTVGYNFDQTVAPGASITAYWYVPTFLEGATIPLTDLADRRGHRHHGLYGGLMVEPRGSTWHDPATGNPITTGAQAVIRWKDADGTERSRREFIVDWEDGLNLWHNGEPLEEAGEADELYERRNRAVNYSTEPFPMRYPKDSEPAWVMSSEVHGDPVTPLFQAYLGDPVWLRILQSSDRARAHNFVLSGHEWRAHTNDPDSTIRSSRPLLMPTQGGTWELLGGAGGKQRQSGDYLYRDGLVPNQTNAGLWGLMRVHGAPVTGLQPLTAAVTTPGDTTTTTPTEPTPQPTTEPAPAPTKPGKQPAKR